MAKFKKGDWVEYVTDANHSKHLDLRMGDIVRIEEDSSDTPYCLRYPDDKFSAISQSRCEITDKAIAAKIAHLLKHGE